MNTPSVFMLNFRGLPALNEEANKWFAIMAAATNAADKADAKAYLDAVIAERDQRLKDYAGGTWEAVKAGFSAPFEALGGSGGAGAPGLASEVADKVADTADRAAGIVKTVAIVAAVGLVVAGMFYMGAGRGRTA